MPTSWRGAVIAVTLVAATAASQLPSRPSHHLDAPTHEQGCIRGLAASLLLTACAQCKDEDDEVDR
jgi:hypothetical protein